MSDTCKCHTGMEEQIKTIELKSDLQDRELKMCMDNLSNNFNEFKKETKNNMIKLDEKIDNVEKRLSGKIDNLEKALPDKIITQVSAAFGKWFIRYLLGGGVITIIIYLIKLSIKAVS
jgi:hypothetical protein